MFRSFPFHLLSLGLPFLAALPACAQQANPAPGETKKVVAPSAAGPLLHPLFSDNAVLQRDRPLPIWGWTTPGQVVEVTLDAKSWQTRADASGKWMVRIGPYRAGGPHTLRVSGPNGEVMATRQNILFGDVWICSGQSNMQFGVGGVNNAEQEIAKADFPNIRLLTVPNVTSLSPRNTINSSWQICTPQTVGNFSAVGYFFGRKLHQEVGVPIGLINSSWGGTVAEAWVSDSALNKMPDFVEPVAAVKRAADDLAKGGGDYQKQMSEWWAKGDPGTQANWNAVDALDATWNLFDLPKNWDAPDGPLPNYDGVVWFRREIQIPAAWAGRDLTLNLGAIDDTDTTWWNGTLLGGMDGYLTKRIYTVPGAQVKAGRNVIAVRVLDSGGGGGIGGDAQDMNVHLVGSNDAPLSLSGAWRYQPSISKDKMPPAPMRADGNPNVPTVLYNSMIAPLTPAAIKGAIWYQGESNAGRAAQYQTLLPTLINDWRARFSGGTFPFHIVQLANFQAPDDAPRDDGWPRLQEAQLLTSRTLPKTGLAIINDIGDANDIHPRNKQDVGLRLALISLAKDYGKEIEYSGPTLKSQTVRGNEFILKFDHAHGGLTLRGDTNRVFAIAGADQKFVWATPKIDGDTITVSAPEVANPVALRFAWSPNPRANLINGAGLPASLFRTDTW